MGQPKADPSTLAATPPSDDRLESWKEIAAYLRRGVRTVQRWEREEGLPVHRHLHDKLGTVYAYRSELDAWWNNRRPKLEAKEAEESEKAKARSRWWAVATAAAGVVAAGVGLWLWLGQHPALPFAERDWVLIAQFENRTGEPVFDGTLEYALERELSNSRFVNVVPRERVNDALQLMKKPTDTVITASVAREVALRDGGIRALLTGRVEKLDSIYLLSVTLVNPGSGVTVRSFSQEGEGEKNVLPAIRLLSRALRESLGEELSQIRLSQEKPEKVTTPSLRAFAKYAIAISKKSSSRRRTLAPA